MNGAAAGLAPASDWRTWEAAGRLPACGDGNEFGTRYAEDFALLAEHGLRAVRLTIDWARLVPAAGRPDATELERLGQVLDAADGAGVGVWACLHDLALPGWFLDEGGFADDKARVWWSRWVELVADGFGDRFAGWVPLAEPVTWALDGYLLGVTPPGRRDPEQLAAAIRGVHLAWRDAWRILRGGAPVATSHRVGPVHAADQTVPAQRQAHLADELLWGSWVSGLRDGILRVPGLAEEEVADLAGSGDVIGIAYEGAIAVTGGGRVPALPCRRRRGRVGLGPVARGAGRHPAPRGRRAAGPAGAGVVARRRDGRRRVAGRPAARDRRRAGRRSRRRDRPARLVPSQRHRRLRGTPRLLGPLRALRPGPQRQGQRRALQLATSGPDAGAAQSPPASGRRCRAQRVPPAGARASAAAPEGGPRPDRLLVEPLRQVQALQHELDGAGHGGR